MAKFTAEARPFFEIITQDVIYEVPPFQREFAWEKEQYAQLWNDLRIVVEENLKEYLLGSIVLEQKKNIKTIYDGQQRLANLAIILSVIRDLYKEELGDQKNADKIQNKYIGSPQYKIKLNRLNRDFFKNYVQETIKPIFRKKEHHFSNILIWETKQFYENEIKRIIGGRKEVEKRKILKSYLDKILYSLIFIEIKVASDVDAFEIFETLNDRGLDLSTSDLIKIRLFIEAKDRGQSLERLNVLWEDLTKILDAPRLSVFFRHYWMSRHSVTTKDELYGKIKNYLRKKSRDYSILNYFKKIVDEAEVYDIITNPRKDRTKDNYIYEKLKVLKVLGVSQCYPLLLSAKNRYSPREYNSKFKEVLDACEKLSFRYSIIGRENPNALEDIYSKISIMARNNKYKKLIKYLRNEIKKIDLTKNDFIKRFNEAIIKNRGIAWYILTKIEKRRFQDEIEIKGDLEHIFPQKLNKHWKKILIRDGIGEDDYKEKYMNRIGNLTILAPKPNKNISNKGYSIKKRIYRSSNWSITKTIPLRYRMWNINAIERRSNELANKASRIWKI